MLGVRFPIPDAFFVLPIRNRDAETIAVADAFDAQIARRFAGEFDHALRHFRVTVGVSSGMRRENDGVVRRFRSGSDCRWHGTDD